MSYDVGQVLYIVLRKEARVYPMQVVEQITKKTFDGEVIVYMVRGGSPTQADNIIAITDIDGEVFDSAEKARKTLIERASASIAQRVDQAIAKAKEWYPSGFESASDDPLSLVRKQTASGGQPPPPVPQKKRPAMRNETAQLAAEMAAEVDDSTMVEVPDGKGGVVMAKVNSVKLPPALQS